MQRNGLSEEEIRRIMQTQASRAERLAIADDVIRNDGDLASLTQQIEKLHQRYLELAAEIPQAKC